MKAPSAVRVARLWGRFGLETVRGLPVHIAHSRDSVTSLPRRILQQWRLLGANAITASDYYMYGLDRAELPWARKREFVGELERWRWLLVFNPEPYRFLTENKVVFKRCLSGLGVPVAPLLGVIGPHGRAETGEHLRTDHEVKTWLEASGVENLVMKPVLGSRGTGVLVLGERSLGDGVASWQRVPAGTISVDDVLAHLRGQRCEFMIEARLRPHPSLWGFSREVLQCARVLTLVDADVSVIGAALRIASGDVAVDNFSRGNLAAPIDLASGRLGPAVMNRTHSLRRVDVHPVTGVPITGVPVPDWSAALAVVRAAAAGLPFNRLLGWDLAFTDRGPVIVEANDIWDPDVSQIAPDAGLLATPLHDALVGSGAIRHMGLGIGARRRERVASPPVNAFPQGD
jgi:Sugar-transfer associated ATP-grasp